MKLGINIDHVATLREARGTDYPDPLEAAEMALAGGADFITVHLREDRRHIQERDVLALLDRLPVRLNLEMAVTEEMVGFAIRTKPADVCLVPEKREELTTEGGLDVLQHESEVRKAVERLSSAGITVSLFIDPVAEQLQAARRVGAAVVELHTGQYALEAEHCSSVTQPRVRAEIQRLFTAARQGSELGLIINAGHGLHRHNLAAILPLPGLNELNIGHAVVARALFIGFPAAVKELKDQIDGFAKALVGGGGGGGGGSAP